MTDLLEIQGTQLAAILSLIVVMGVIGWSLSRSGRFGVGVVIAKSLAVITIWVTFGLAVTGNEQLGNVALVAVGALAGALTQRQTPDEKKAEAEAGQADASDPGDGTPSSSPTAAAPDLAETGAEPAPSPPESAVPQQRSSPEEPGTWP
jgi:hypothetical protein